MFVTRHSNVTNLDLREKLWRLYDVSSHGSAGEAVTRATLFRDEFDDVLGNPANRLWVVWDDSVPVGCAAIATDIASTRHLSRHYFERHYPDHMMRQAVHYVLWAVVHPSFVARGVWFKLAKEAFALEADEAALVVFDAPQVTQPEATGGLAEMMAHLASVVSNGTPVQQIEVQRYFVADFALGRRASGARRAEEPPARATTNSLP
jgi:hypothetical protein